MTVLTEGCDGGQIAASDVECMVIDALRRPQWNWPDSAKQRLAQLASTWDVLWPQKRGRALADLFETLTWRSRTRRLLVRLRSEPSLSPERDQRARGGTPPRRSRKDGQFNVRRPVQPEKPKRPQGSLGEAAVYGPVAEVRTTAKMAQILTALKSWAEQHKFP